MIKGRVQDFTQVLGIVFRIVDTENTCFRASVDEAA